MVVVTVIDGANGSKRVLEEGIAHATDVDASDTVVGRSRFPAGRALFESAPVSVARRRLSSLRRGWCGVSGSRPTFRRVNLWSPTHIEEYVREYVVTHQPAATDSEATVTVDPATPDSDPISPTLFGKFGEHRYSPRNAKNALEAQILHNPTVGSWTFQVDGWNADGGRQAAVDPDTKTERIEAYADFRDYPDGNRLDEAYRNGTALW